MYKSRPGLLILASCFLPRIGCYWRIAFFLCWWLPQVAYAWNETGHRVVAYIAYTHLTPKAQRRVANYLCTSGVSTQRALFFL